jgi:hypothetical protein
MTQATRVLKHATPKRALSNSGRPTRRRAFLDRPESPACPRRPARASGDLGPAYTRVRLRKKSHADRGPVRRGALGGLRPATGPERDQARKPTRAPRIANAPVPHSFLELPRHSANLHSAPLDAQAQGSGEKSKPSGHTFLGAARHALCIDNSGAREGIGA